jgi:hypothetical protein
MSETGKKRREIAEIVHDEMIMKDRIDALAERFTRARELTAKELEPKTQPVDLPRRLPRAGPHGVLRPSSRDPNAQDTVEGIAEWWVMEQRIRCMIREVKRALADAYAAEDRLKELLRQADLFKEK